MCNVRNLVNKITGRNIRSDVYTFIRAVQAKFEWADPVQALHADLRFLIIIVLFINLKFNSFE